MSLSMKGASKLPHMRRTNPWAYKGDPGLFGFLGKVAKGVAGAALGVARSLPGVGTGVSAIEGVIRGTAPAQRGPVPYTMAGPGNLFTAFGGSAPQITMQTAARNMGGLPVPRRPMGYGTMPTAAAPGLQTPPPAAKGWRPNKSGYYVQAVPGQPEQGGVWVPPESAWVRSRRRNPANSRANDRAISRIKSAKRMAKSLGRITIRDACNHR